MNASTTWWTEVANLFLSDTLAFINSSKQRDESVERCDDLCKALNKTWNGYYRYRKQRDELTEKEQQKGRSDAQAFTQLLLTGLTSSQAEDFCNRESVRHLAEFTPHIMNHDTLIKREYDPYDITDKIRKEASAEHRQMMNACQRYSAAPDNDGLRVALLKKLEVVVFIVRCNIAHSEKTPKGPDIQKMERDRTISEITSVVINDLFDVLFDGPHQRLATYGTLVPGGTNAEVLENVDGQWEDGTASGRVTTEHGFPVFTWLVGGEDVPVKVLSAPSLQAHFDRLDKFEGPRYRRILVPVSSTDGLSVCYIYEGN